MKFKNVLMTQNKILMIFILILCLITSVGWILLDEPIIGLIYILLTLLLGIIYFYTSYEITDKHLIVNLGFFDLKFKYTSILDIKEKSNGLIIYTKYFRFHTNPHDKEAFIKQIENNRKAV